MIDPRYNEKHSLILCSTSEPRAKLMKRLSMPFFRLAPDVDETPRPNEAPHLLVKRLSIAKAKSGLEKIRDNPAMQEKLTSPICIGSDQAVLAQGQILGKPETHEAAVEQLKYLSGKTVAFHTGVAVCSEEQAYYESNLTSVSFRRLYEEEIEAYLEKEEALDAAGSFYSERLGIALIERMQTNDSTALVGLPLIALTSLLRMHGVNPIVAPTAQSA